MSSARQCKLDASSRSSRLEPSRVELLVYVVEPDQHNSATSVLAVQAKTEDNSLVGSQVMVVQFTPSSYGTCVYTPSRSSLPFRKRDRKVTHGSPRCCSERGA